MKDVTLFCQCVYNESKKAYSKWLKVLFYSVGIIIGLVIAYYIGTIILIIVPYFYLTQIMQFMDNIPWFVYICILILLLPLSYATGVCIEKRIKSTDTANLLVFLLVLIIMTGVTAYVIVGSVFLTSLCVLTFVLVLGMCGLLST